MAEKTTPAKKAASKEPATIAEQLIVKRQDLLDARRSLAAGELINPRVIAAHRKDIARLLTQERNNKEGK